MSLCASKTEGVQTCILGLVSEVPAEEPLSFLTLTVPQWSNKGAVSFSEFTVQVFAAADTIST